MAQGKPRDRIVYVGRFELPDRDAAAMRVRAIADALEEGGYAVDLFGDDVGNRSASERKSGVLRKTALKVFRGIDYLVTAKTYLRQLEGIDWERVAAVICYPGTAALVWRLLRLCHRRGVPLILDVVEWYKPSHTPFGRFGPFALESELRMRWLQERSRNLICISSLLERYYAGKGCHVIRVPPPLGKHNPAMMAPVLDPIPGRISLVYFGNPGRRELFGEIVAGVQASRRRGIDVVFRVTGVTEARMLAILSGNGVRRPSLEGVECYGRLPSREMVLEIVGRSDFSVLVRPRERFADACFPTKFVESLAMGVPVMANVTTDLGEYLRDGREGYILDEPTAAAVERAILRAWNRTPEEVKLMRLQARLRAQECFDYRRYTQQLADFVGAAQLC